MRNTERNIMDSVGHGATHHPTKTRRQEDGMVTEKETAREPRKVESSNEEKAETKGKEKGQERKDNVSTKSQNHQKSSGQVDLGNNGQNNLGMLKQTLRVGGTMIGTQQIRILRPQRQLRNFNMRLSVICDSRMWVLSNTLNLFSMTDWTLHSQLSHLVLIPLHVKLLFLPITWILGPQRLPAGRDKFYDQGKRILCTLDGTGKPMAIESRKVNCRRPLMAVTEMMDCGRWVCFGPHGQGFSFDPRSGHKIEFTPTPGGWHLTMKLEPPERANKILNRAIQEISAKKRAAVEARDYGAITDTDGLVRIMGCDPFRRPGFSL